MRVCTKAGEGAFRDFWQIGDSPKRAGFSFALRDNASNAGRDPIKPRNIPDEIKTYSNGRTSVITGNTNRFAMETQITEPVAMVSQQGRGFFAVYIDVSRFGVRGA
jgi:hypothetical protein